MRQPMNATGWWPRCGMDPGVQHTRSCVTLMRSLERTVPFSRQPHLTRTVQMFAHANVCTKNSPGQGRMMAKCYIMRCAMRRVGEVQRSPNAPHPVWRGGLSKGAIRCISPFHGFHHLASITFHIQAQGLVCAMVPIGAAVWSKKPANLAALAACLVASTVNLGCRVEMNVSISYI
jgi:hypothetical protein